jgi:pimeloyl-ACP methyl ester carboxylesterase
MVQLFAKMSNVILVAPSMSSKYALPFAVTEPERLAGLVLVGPVGTGLVPRRKLELLQVSNFFKICVN